MDLGSVFSSFAQAVNRKISIKNAMAPILWAIGIIDVIFVFAGTLLAVSDPPTMLKGVLACLAFVIAAAPVAGLAGAVIAHLASSVLRSRKAHGVDQSESKRWRNGRISLQQKGLIAQTARS